METIFTTERVRPLLARVREFVETELIPLEADFSHQNLKAVLPVLDQKREQVRAAGLWGLALSVAEGGHGLTLCEFGQISEVLAYAPFFGHYVFGCQAPDIGNIELLHKFASPELKERYLKPLMAGQIRSCFSMTEPDFAGSNPTRMATMAVREGDEYVINGRKWFTSSADGAAFAVVMAVTNPEAAPHQRASMIIVPTDTPGFTIERNIPVFGEAGEGWFSHAEVTYTNCRVPMSNVIAGEGMGFRLAQERLGPGRVHHCMRWVGNAEKALDLLCKRAATREIEDDVMLGEKQFIQDFIAESRAEIDACRLYVLNTAYMIDTVGVSNVREAVSAIKFYVANAFLRVLDRAIQVHGALGVTDDTVLSAMYRHERGARIWDGADEVHKQNLAISILKRYGLDIKQKAKEIRQFRKLMASQQE
ncbi:MULTISPECIES: acyl-CoA dehydrogenase family protein [unclassified Spirosoma]|uniref:acyl-CoA dehydrogenase family protein n=1 Tax=unclassified Spirosoma TaxID=2621999 RepID=UPI000964CD15|nr:MULTISPECIES: acyl-CoA dehydrogenase family protein [unclassified Spirosoma]MBN8821053.1 acyl-CoA dehydrogenase family protein [Spirosoma sp.]OJW79307.1 MAG: acyl-CoA dehydrogenase [Spirosoma sp. 48-14]